MNNKKLFLFFILILLNVNEIFASGSSSMLSSTKEYFISKSGVLAECEFDIESLNLTLTPAEGKSSSYVLSKSGDKFENDSTTFSKSGDTAKITGQNYSNESFFPADRYSGNIKNEESSSGVSEFFFTDAVTNVYVLRIPLGTVSGHWYLLKGDSPEFDSTYNTTLYELLLPDDKTTFQCFMQDMENPNILILLSKGCNIKEQEDFYLKKEN